MHTYIEFGLILSSLCFWFYIDSVKIFEQKILNSALIHSIVCGVGINVGYIYNPTIIYNYIVTPDLYEILIIVPLISLGYSLYDVYIGIKNCKIDDILHGIVFVFCNMYVYFNNAILLSYIFLLTESSSIFLNLRPFRKRWIDLSFGLSFLIYRIIGAPLLAGIYLSDPNNPHAIFGFISAISLTTLNVYWFSLIVKKLLKNNKNVLQDAENKEHLI
jgi:hypothetical protein